jgi:peptidyl-tRNA hydrolase, PTH1 family
LKYLIAGLGNPGQEYENTRHNIGFKILDALAGVSNIAFKDKRYGYVAEMKYKSRTLVLLKPTTFMNLSGKAINYWLQKEKIPDENLLVLLDDIALDVGKIRIRPKGGDGGHNGLANINAVLGHNHYARLRFGIGNNFYHGQQVDYVLGQWDEEEKKLLMPKMETCHDVIKSFCTLGLEKTMTLFNNK